MPKRPSPLPVDTFLLALLATVAVATVLRARGTAAGVVSVAAKVAIAPLFWLYGARLSPQQAWHGVRQWFGRTRPGDAIVLLFCGSKKSLASGLPMALVLFPAATVGVIMLPLMIFHQVQLVVCAVIASRLSRDRIPSATAKVDDEPGTAIEAGPPA